MFCNKCGHENPDDAAFCNKCGAATSATAAAPRASAVPAETEVWSGGMHWKGALSFWWLLSFLLLVPILIFAIHVWLKRGIRYRLTTDRLSIERGIVTRQSEDIQLVRVEDVQYHQGVLNRMLGVGNVRVLSTDKTDPDLLIEGIEDPAKLKETMWNLVRERRRGTVMMEQVKK